MDTSISPAVEQKLQALLSELDIMPKTLSILADHDYITAASLRTATGEELKQLGISSGQVAEIKSKFNNNGPVSSNVSAAAASFSSPHPPMGSATVGAAAAAASVIPQPSATDAAAVSAPPLSSRFFDAATEPAIKLSPIFGIMNVALTPLVESVAVFVIAGVVDADRAAAMALHLTADRVCVCQSV